MIIVRHTPGSALGLFRLSRRSKGLRIPYELRRRMWVAESVIYKTGSMPQGTLGFSASRPVISRGFYLGIWIKSKHKGMHFSRQTGSERDAYPPGVQIAGQSLPRQEKPTDRAAGTKTQTAGQAYQRQEVIRGRPVQPAGIIRKTVGCPFRYL
jgi:hypothetical protein